MVSNTMEDIEINVDDSMELTVSTQCKCLLNNILLSQVQCYVECSSISFTHLGRGAGEAPAICRFLPLPQGLICCSERLPPPLQLALNIR